MTFSSMVWLKDGSTLGLFHRGALGHDANLQVLQSITRDGGFTWSQPVLACNGTKLDGKDPFEPYVFRSPNGDELCCLMRENKRSGTSLVMFSRDEGKTWSQSVDAPWGLTGDRHHGIRLPDGRMVIVVRGLVRCERKDPTGPATGTARVQRGGDWSSDSKRCRSAARIGRDPSSYRGVYLGFRIVLHCSK